MNDMTPDRNERKANLKGLGSSRKRVEDLRFTQGKGNYVDDIKLEGMLHGDFVRSPYAHARIKSINTDAALPPFSISLMVLNCGHLLLPEHRLRAPVIAI
mgnify:CR=1 FL=1